jgi:hypothetical protein
MKETVESTIPSDPQPHPPALGAVKRHASPISIDFRVMELELENLRLQRLVAELLLKNQKLRKDEGEEMAVI